MRILRPKDKGYAAALAGLQRISSPDPSVSKTVAEILAKVSAKGDAALLEFTKKFGGPELKPFQISVTPAEIAEACNSLPPATAQALQQGPQALAQALTLAQAVPEASEARPILMTGSLYLLSEFFTLHPQGLLQPQARQA